MIHSLKEIREKNKASFFFLFVGSHIHTESHICGRSSLVFQHRHRDSPVGPLLEWVVRLIVLEDMFVALSQRHIDLSGLAFGIGGV